MTTEPQASTGVQRALGLETVPREKWTVMVWRTVIGAVFNGWAVLGAFKLDWDGKVVIGLVVAGCTIWSTQLVTKAALALVQPVKAFRAALKGNGNGGTPP